MTDKIKTVLVCVTGPRLHCERYYSRGQTDRTGRSKVVA
jgi:hypothetical protein